VRRILTAAVATALLAALIPSTASAGRSCGSINFSGTRTTIYVLRGVTCREAKRAARAYARFDSYRGWKCALAHGDSRFRGRQVGFSCGKGQGSGDLRKFPRAFLGLV
jgi:hypothetical protein